MAGHAWFGAAQGNGVVLGARGREKGVKARSRTGALHAGEEGAALNGHGADRWHEGQGRALVARDRSACSA